MNVLLLIMCVVYLVLMIIAAHKELFILQTPTETPHIDVDKIMINSKQEERSIGPDQFKKFRSTLDRTANTSLGYLVTACTIAVFILFAAWANFGSKAIILCLLGIAAGFIYYIIIKTNQKKRIFVQNREKFRMQLGYVLDTETKSIDYIYKKPSGTYHKGTTNLHKVLVGIMGKNGTPEAYLVKMDPFTFEKVMQSELCDVVTYDGAFVAACYLIQKEPKEISLFK